jgi:DNA-binding GntR family transcriptional regulator
MSGTSEQMRNPDMIREAPALRIVASTPEPESEKNSLVSDAYRALKASILNGTLPAGYQAVEKRIAEQLKMSRTPVHEAIIRLESEGFLRVLPRRGVQILRLSADDMRETYDVIIALEGMAGALIAARSKESGAVIALMTAQTDDMERALEQNDLKAWAMADDHFHRILVTDCGNVKLARLAATMTDQAHRARLATLRMREKPVVSIAEHRDILSALSSGNVEAARAAIEKHRYRASREIIDALAGL